MEEVLNRVADSIPTLENSKYKGNMGRIGVLGGSKEYVLGIFKLKGTLVRPTLPALPRFIAELISSMCFRRQQPPNRSSATAQS
nr:unnamed protein product [Spirometra erinaceieuropaei]